MKSVEGHAMLPENQRDFVREGEKPQRPTASPWPSSSAHATSATR